MLSRLILSLFGWRITGRYPVEVDKMILAAGPHTSNWDFPLGLLVRNASGVSGHVAAKHTLLKPPFGWFFRWVGCIPVDRSKPTQFVRQVVEIFQSRKRVHLVISPEGTRKKVRKFKTGFYWIAKEAGVPILLVKFDYEHKEVNFGEFFWPGEDADKDMAWLWNYYKGVKGKNPEFGVG